LRAMSRAIAVVLPAPRAPVTTHTGIGALKLASA
jgi:hypothetical protein